MAGRRLRIAVDANLLAGPWGGIPKYVRRICAALAEGGDEILLFGKGPSWAGKVRGARDIAIPFKGERGWRAVALPTAARLARADVLWAPGMVLPRWSPVPTAVTVHDLAPLMYPDSKPPAVVEAFHTTLPRSARSARRVICVSESTASDVRSWWHIDSDRIVVAPCGVDECFTPGDPEAARRAVRGRHGIDEPYILHVGSLEPRKGLDVLLAAAATRPPWRLVLVGRLAYGGERLAAEARAAGAVLLEAVDDEALVDLYRGAQAVAAPALHEGFGIVPLEAMASGTPVAIASDAGALTEISGAAAVVVAQRTPEAWVAGLEEAVRRRDELTPHGLRHAARFTWADAARRVRAALAEAAA